MPPRKNRPKDEQQELGLVQDTNSKYGQYNQIDNNYELQKYQTTNIDIVIFHQYKESKTLFQHQKAYINQNNEIVLSEILKNIKASGFEFTNAMISYFDPISDLYRYCGRDPLDHTVGVPISCINSNQLEIKLRCGQRNIVDMLIQEQKNKEENDETEARLNPTSANANQKNNRVKERKIGEVVEKVALWRRFYTGFYDENGKFINMPLDNAALKVGISKKTLDDYLLQIRCGKKYGFNFNKNLSERIGKLRSFVKSHKNKESNNQGYGGNDSGGEDNDA
ncbi:hypothetical protein TTHERM_00363200 (macronuclear) [Tetrahymena thermophila SB210]|uniref:Uncharacterized protein n=1 Tax=Tetrahymena thermophila (strain SB210) TaxID=312017 RepID=Q22PC3_TETTS|nr:hypothetical protein TTHERM_00363200 [Tetrahymena thermophila SB210]EAR87186.1 hypothetical protein TTHERM_00363200 [Tetrahymena thermophila SB210]|eukprot:XP_001007431.1 hypothetical protein TTHERM_00363200 [Tetrahymena thermophila SB210]